MVPSAKALAKHYGELTMPVILMAGKEDLVARPGHNSVRLQRAVPHSTLTLVPDMGHMIQHLSQEKIVAAVGELANRAGGATTWMPPGGQRARMDGEDRPAE